MNRNDLDIILGLYKLDQSDISLLRHNENMTYRVGNKYLLQIQKPIEGFRTNFIYEGLNRNEVRNSELKLLYHLRKKGMIMRETLENCHHEFISNLQDETTAILSRWIDGEALNTLELNEELCYQIGELTANLHANSTDFDFEYGVTYDQSYCVSLKRKIESLMTHGLFSAYGKVMTSACNRIEDMLSSHKHEFVILHGDLSPSNILKTQDGLVLIDFSFFGFGHPMLDLAILFGNVNGLIRRQNIVKGYQKAGGFINYQMLDASFIMSLLGGICLHFDQWYKQDWFLPRMERWIKETFEPFLTGERLFADDFTLLNLPKY